MSRFESLKPRTDSLGRVLYPGETQRSDGMYCFRYTDLDGVRRAVYSWRLIEKDPVPEGKQNRKVLREVEKEIRKALEAIILTE